MNSWVLVGVKGENGKRNREKDAELASVAWAVSIHQKSSPELKVFACSKSAGKVFLYKYVMGRCSNSVRTILPS